MAKTEFAVIDELPKATRGRTYQRTDADDGLDALDRVPVGKALALKVGPDDVNGVRARYANGARQRGKKTVTRYQDGTLYIAYAAETVEK